MARSATHFFLLCGLLVSGLYAAGPTIVTGSYTVQISADSAPPGSLLACRARLLPALPGQQSLGTEPVSAISAGPGQPCIVRLPYVFAAHASSAQLLYEVESISNAAPRRTARQIAVTLPPSGSATLSLHTSF